MAKLAESVRISSESSWSWCQRTNGTYTDCPIAAYAESTDFDMIVATHNPSNLAMQTVELKMPSVHFRAEALQQQNWVAAKSNVICNWQQKEFHPSESVTDCNMYIEQQVLPGQVAFTKVTYDASVEDTCTHDGSVIENDELSLEYIANTDAGL